jgi:endoglycosylceramidase
MPGWRAAVRSLALVSLALVSLAFLPGGPASALAAPDLPLRHAGRWITDAHGRVVIVHGINMVYKLPPYSPAAVGFGDDDAVFLARSGFNVVRVGVIWKAVEPRPAAYDDGYLRAISATVRTLARHGILSLLDFHQDLYNERFQGEGAPDWAVQDGGLLNPRLGFPVNYLANLALEHALDAFWANAPGPGGVGLQARFAAAWRRVAARFRADPAVLGYELFNEPFPGTLWEPCLGLGGCAGFDGQLTTFYRRVDNAIRSIDPRTLVWYEPNVLFNEGIPTRVGSLGDPGAGFAFHDYCPTEATTGSPLGCSGFDDTTFSNALAGAAAVRSAVMMTEFGATADAPYLTEMVARADRLMVPWIEWAYCGCSDPTTTGPGNNQALVIDPRKPPGTGNVELGTVRALVEPYPQVIAGTPQSWSYDRAAHHFLLRYSSAVAGTPAKTFPAGSISEISTPAMVYGRRYMTQVSGGVVVSSPGASLLRIASCPGATDITVSLTASGTTHGSCPQPRRRRHRRRRLVKSH